MAGLRIHLPNPYIDVGDVPVRVEIRDSSLDLVQSLFMPFGESWVATLDSGGMYVVEAEMPSGQRLRKVVTLGDDEEPSVDLEPGGLSPHETHAWAYLNKGATQRPAGSLAAGKYEGTWVRLWQRGADGKWHTAGSELGNGSTWDHDGVNYDLQSFGGLQLLQVGGPEIPWKLVALPGAQQLRILIRPAAVRSDDVHPLDVIVSTRNSGAEAILSLLVSGAVERAREIETAGAAELMLYSKMADPTAAAIGGYYLLRIGDLDRLHNWTQNLANWIEWMADGPVIRAWHVLKDARLHGGDRRETQQIARRLLLEAVERGIPVYTEGLRLLRDGLNLLCQDQADIEAHDAKAVVDRYAQACDWSAPTTTFLGATPDQPHPEPVFGKPASMKDLAFLFNVDLQELIRQGIVDVGSTLTLERYSEAPLKVHVEEDGGLTYAGKRYERLQEVAESAGLPQTLQYEWRRGDANESIFEELNYLRHGRLAVYEK